MKEQNKSEQAFVTMELTPAMEKAFKEFPFFLEIEMLQGEKENLPNGRVRYSIEINNADKSDIMREFCLKMISLSHKTNLS